MSYTPTTDFVALLRQTSGGERFETLPGVDFVISALMRLGLITVSVGQTAPVSNQVSTAWFKPAQPSWSAEGNMYLWNAATSEYELATPALWAALLQPLTSGYSFQSVATGVATINPGVSLFAVQRVNPTATTLTLPNLAQQYASARKLQIVDFSTSVVNHAITLVTPDGSTIMQKASFRLQSTADSLVGVMLQPSPDLNSWIIAP
jgi:hypothetical protein